MNHPYIYKKCSTCSYIYKSREEYLKMVKYIGVRKYKELYCEYSNCFCGTTLVMKTKNIQEEWNCIDDESKCICD